MTFVVIDEDPAPHLTGMTLLGTSTAPALRSEVHVQELIVRAKAGDSQALDTLYRRYAGGVMRVAYYITGSVQDAEDVLQDVFLGLPTALGRYEPQGKFDRWLNRVAARVALSRVRHRGSRAEIGLSESLPVETASIGDTLEQIRVGDAVRALPDTLRAVFVLKVVEGYSHAETAATLGISVAASQMRLSRAFRLLQGSLDR